MKKIKIKAPAKINLFLEVLGRRADGYHEIESLLQMIGLYDELVMEETLKGDLVLECPQAPSLATPDNLVYRAARALLEYTGKKRSARIILSKNIPLAAGLGGGSADAAAALWGLNCLWNLSLSTAQLVSLGAKLGSDIPFFFSSPLALARGRGEQVENLSWDWEWEMILVNPRILVSTAEIYNALRLELTNDRRSINMPLKILSSLNEKRDEEKLRLWTDQFFNRLETAAVSKFPVIGKCMEAMRSAGLWGVRMSGSGPTVYGFLPPQYNKEELLKKFEPKGWWSTAARTLRVNPFYHCEEMPGR
jgi:4-diphosphocytidyl-2-C-methyl-D-erythritol kinase